MAQRVFERFRGRKGWLAHALVVGVASGGGLAGDSNAAAAQFVAWMPQSDWFASVSLERPRHPDALGFQSVLGHVAVGYPFRPRITIVTGMSVTHSRLEGRPSSTVISNAYFEVLFGGDGTFGSLTFTFPTSGRLVNTEAYAADAGFAADIEMPERFTPSTSGAAFRLHPRWRLGELTVGLRAGLAAVAPSGLRREFYARYGAFLERPIGAVRLGTEVTGAAFLNPSRLLDRTLGDVTVLHATLFAGSPDAPLSPHLFARLPLEDDTRTGLRALVGVRLSY